MPSSTMKRNSEKFEGFRMGVRAYHEYLVRGSKKLNNESYRAVYYFLDPGHTEENSILKMAAQYLEPEYRVLPSNIYPGLLYRVIDDVVEAGSGPGSRSELTWRPVQLLSIEDVDVINELRSNPTQ